MKIISLIASYMPTNSYVKVVYDEIKKYWDWIEEEKYDISSIGHWIGNF
jgi:hypothetical protein